MANYTVPATDWTDIATLLDTEYDVTADYALYTNEIPLGLLQFEVADTKPTNTGKLLRSFTTQEIGVGAGSTTWVKASANPIEIYVYEKPSA